MGTTREGRRPICKQEVTGSIPVGSIAEVPANGPVLARSGGLREGRGASKYRAAAQPLPKREPAEGHLTRAHWTGLAFREPTPAKVGQCCIAQRTTLSRAAEDVADFRRVHVNGVLVIRLPELQSSAINLESRLLGRRRGQAVGRRARVRG